MEVFHQRHQTWNQLVSRIGVEYAQLATSEKHWISSQLQILRQCQLRMDELFKKAAGLDLCRDCQGGCCARGHNHMTLANLLNFLEAGETLPNPDFSRTCPFLSDSGCLLESRTRPYNCITFLCDNIEDKLTAAEVKDYYRFDRELRSVYKAFASRYAGGSMTGLLIQAERLHGSQFLGLKNDVPSAHGVSGPTGD